MDEAVLRILELKNKLGLFENPYKDADESKEKEIILCKEHKALAREAACKSFVLLKNESVLPLKKGQHIAFIGPTQITAACQLLVLHRPPGRHPDPPGSRPGIP